MNARARDMRRAMRQARRLMAGHGDDIRAGFDLERRIVMTAQRRAAFYVQPFHVVRLHYRAEYLAKMGEARRAGDRAAWRDAKAWLDIWDAKPPMYPWARVA